MRSDNTQLLWKGDEHPPLDLLREYQEHALPQPESLAVERHLVSCEICTDLVQGMTLSDRTTTRKAVQDLNAQLRNLGSRKRKRRLPLIPLLDWRAAASILVLLCSVGLMVFYIYDQIKEERLATSRKAEIAAEAELYAISTATDTLLIAVPGYEISAAPATTPAAHALMQQRAAATATESGKAESNPSEDNRINEPAAGMVAGAAVKNKPNSLATNADRRSSGKVAKVTADESEKMPPSSIAATSTPGPLKAQEKDINNAALKNPVMVDSLLEQSAAKSLQGRMAGVAVQDKTKISRPDIRTNQSFRTEKAAAPTVIRSTHESMAVELPTAGKQLKGQVLSEEGEPLPGVTVVVKGTQTGTSTDTQGNFVLTAPTDNPTLAFNYIGYKTEELKVDTRAATVKVELKPALSALNEVVVVGDEIRNSAELPFIKPEPIGGMKAFENYLKKHRRYPSSLTSEKVTGRVVVGFTVTAQGNLENIHIRKSLHPALDAEALRLVKEGPAWKPAMPNNKPVPQEVKVSIRFRPK